MSVKFLKYMDEFFFHTNDFPLLESGQLYMIAKYKVSNCSKIEAVIQKCSVNKSIYKYVEKLTGKSPCQSPFFKKFAAQKETLANVFFFEYWEIFVNSFFIEHLRGVPLVKLEPSLLNQQNFSSSYFWLHLIPWAPSTFRQNSCKTRYPQKKNLWWCPFILKFKFQNI